ncbi:hypothetical protein PSTT_10156 [Puccinia striiformis]|uniref:Uncharacterized protein n=1 Tax=Puccinia striiformis TaxID=27350 RepID=A0A2S4V5N0_9BASI|nr:hypothetical protein PSTT_10156 [Puccinia striiformis]
MHLLVTYLKSARSVGLILYWLVALVSAPHPIKPICEWWEEGPRETPKVSLHQLFTPGWSEQHDQAEWSWEAARLLMPSALRPQSPASPSTAPTSIPYSAFLGEDSLGTQPGSRKHGQSEATDSNPASSEPASAKTNAFTPEVASQEERDPQPLAKKRKNGGQSINFASDSNPTTSSPANPAYTPPPSVVHSASNANSQEHAGIETAISEDQAVEIHPKNPGHDDENHDGPRIALNEGDARDSSAQRKRLYSDLSSTGPSCLSDSAKLSILLLRRYQDKFQQIVNTKLFHANSREWIPYDGASFGMVRRPLRAPGFVLRIFRQSEQGVQPAMVMGTLYKSLLKWIYKIHRKLLNDLEISTDVHYSRQKQMFDWLHSQIFTDLDGAPLMGLRESKTEKWEDKETLGLAKLELVNFLSREKNDDQLASSSATKLVELFENEHPLHPAPSASLQQSRQTSIANPEHQYIAADDPLIKSSISAFTGACRRQPSLRNLDLSIHPRLSTSIYFLQNTPGYGVLRIVTQQKQEAIHVNDMPVFYKRLIRAIDCIHFHVFKRLRTTGEGIVSRRRQLSYWLLRIIFNPETGLPLTGKIKLHHADLAPWEDASFVRAGDLYDPIQLNLIEYFAKDQNPDNLKTHAAFILTAWYQAHYPDELNSLLKKDLEGPLVLLMEISPPPQCNNVFSHQTRIEIRMSPLQNMRSAL